MREQLVGYLLGSLEEEERQLVEAELKTNQSLQREADLLRESLQPLRSVPAWFSAPPGLAERTCQFVTRRVEIERDSRPVPMIREPLAGRGWWSASDALIAAGVCFVAATILFPALVQSRHGARLAGCQDHLRQLGVSLAQYSQADPEGNFPSLWSGGRLASAGVYASKLLQKGYLGSASSLLCPGSKLAAQPQRCYVPTEQELAQADGERLANLERTMGGSFGYNLGYLDQGAYRSVRNLGRATYAVMADAPTPHLENHRSDNHGPGGQNVLYEDGHVRYRTNSYQSDHDDHIFLNDNGIMAAGNHVSDAVIGHSASRPLPLMAAPQAPVFQPVAK